MLIYRNRKFPYGKILKADGLSAVYLSDLGGKMSLLEEWRIKAYSQEEDAAKQKAVWEEYFVKEKKIYEQLLKTPDTEVKGSVEELAAKYDMTIMQMTGFLDGINDSLVNPNPIEEMDKDTQVSLLFDKEKLYKNMIAAKADWLYGLSEWDSIFDEEKRKELYKEQINSGTFKRETRKVMPNDMCPCGSGKKYKKCHGRGK